MLDQFTYDFVGAASGRIIKVYSNYTAFVGLDCDAGQSPPVVEWGAFFRFDTSNLPDHCDVTAVKFRSRRDTDPDGEPDDYEIRFSIGDIIGGTLDGTAAEWNAGPEVLTLTTRPADKTTLDFAEAANALVNKAGDTDVKILDHSTQGGGSASWSTNFNKSTIERCRLYIYFTVPSATATMVGSASCSASVVHAAEATASATGTAELGAGLLLSTASATASGVGSGTLRAGIIRLCSASVLASGSVGVADPTLICGGIATATAEGAAELAAGLLHSSAAATATAVFTATGAGGIVVPPLALHSLTIAVSAVDAEEVSVSAVNVATISVADDDALELTPRRNV
jgi:hypothetical protein